MLFFGKTKSQRAYRMDPVLRAKVLKRDKYMCKYCGSKHNLHVDHIKPRSQGGKDTMGNLVAACSRCNLSKGAKTLPGFTKKAEIKKYSKVRKKIAKERPVYHYQTVAKPKRRWWLMWVK